MILVCYIDDFVWFVIWGFGFLCWFVLVADFADLTDFWLWGWLLFLVVVLVLRALIVILLCFNGL